ncbi:zinc finger, CCHC-type containing protein [Tanacetum coccineum]|uniref:Zinc finger, CCHC-type containing protein n=1 Tax=Tanacetum coccineum TaxID=301880 RepID=A0ABQ5AQ14_9ASTR
MLTACNLLNRIPNKRNKTTPYELWFYVIEPNESVSINSIIESIDAIFDENRFSSIPRPKDIIPNLAKNNQLDNHTDDVPSEILEPRKEEDPRTYNEAMQSRDAAFWKEAIDDEIGSIMENNTWLLSDLPLGFRQKEGIDYFDTYAPVARITIIRLLLALTAIHNLVIHQMDVKTAFWNGDLDEEVYIKQPKGFVMPGNEHKIKRENKRIVITQSHYIEKILKKFNREDFSPVNTPMDPVEKLKPNTGKPIKWMGVLAWERCHFMGFQEVNMETETATGKEAEWLRNLIYEIPIWPKPIAPKSIRCESVLTMAKAYSQVFNGKSKHLGVRRSMIRKLIMKG